MPRIACTLFTIIVQDELQSRLLEELRTLGVKGYTMTKAIGSGSHSARESEWEGENVMIHLLVPSELADRIFDHLEHHYFERYGVTAYTVPAEILRREKIA